GFGSAAQAQRLENYRIGVIYPGGPFSGVVEGLRDGLKELGLEDGKQIRLEIRDSKGDVNAAKESAKSFERDKVNVVYAVAMSVVVAAKESTSHVPVVFVVGTDPIRSQLIQSFAKPGGRLTGVYYLASDLTPKRLEILKEIVPRLRKVVTFYNPHNPVSIEAAKLGREAARQMKLQFIEQHATSVDELRQGFQNMKPGDADAFFYVSDAWITSQAGIVIEESLVKKLPTMFQEQSLVAAGGLASYGQNYHEIGRMSAKHVQKILTGTRPQDLRVETADKFEMALNLKTAKHIGLTIQPSLLARADRVIR
ncbi:MAG TPA: ABC transporter substrate-binding protein, partial [Candidatus Acidoferrales bacterium]|nr:ABC transporter substrate-binding protein [Candidatus Acidoferrales bacterium]